MNDVLQIQMALQQWTVLTLNAQMLGELGSKRRHGWVAVQDHGAATAAPPQFCCIAYTTGFLDPSGATSSNVGLWFTSAPRSWGFCGLGCSGDFNGFGGKEGEGQEEAGQTATLWPQETQEWTLGYEEQTRLFV